jgi:hypothetical protein
VGNEGNGRDAAGGGKMKRKRQTIAFDGYRMDSPASRWKQTLGGSLGVSIMEEGEAWSMSVWVGS